MTMDAPTLPRFGVVPGAAVARALEGDEKAVIDVIRAAYECHGAGDTVNPPSYFLRFPDAPSNRIIALPAAVGGTVRRAGLKWIASFPDNVAHGLPRASAVLVLNDLDTGYPVACLESSIISATRTAASAALAAQLLGAGRPAPRVGFIGTGLIARYVLAYLAAGGIDTSEIAVHDQVPAYAEAFAEAAAPRSRVEVHTTAESLVRSSDLVVFATTASIPHVTDPSWFDHHPLVLHLSLRDLGHDVVTSSVNVVDDVEHCLKADTSLHLVEQVSGNRDHVHATLHEVATGLTAVPADRTVVFSPFGLGVLDIALADHVLAQAEHNGHVVHVDDFFHDLDRFGTPAGGAGA